LKNALHVERALLLVKSYPVCANINIGICVTVHTAISSQVDPLLCQKSVVGRRQHHNNVS